MSTITYLFAITCMSTLYPYAVCSWRSCFHSLNLLKVHFGTVVALEYIYININKYSLSAWKPYFQRHMCGLVYVQWVAEMRGDISSCWFWWNSWPWYIAYIAYYGISFEAKAFISLSLSPFFCQNDVEASTSQLPPSYARVHCLNYSYTFLCHRCPKYCPMPIHIVFGYWLPIHI